MKLSIFALLICITFTFTNSLAKGSTKAASPDLSEQAIFEKLESLSTLRNSLASQIKGGPVTITEETFKNTCMPVGKELKRWSEENGVQAKQISQRNRNPAAAPISKDEKIAYQKFIDDPQLRQWTTRSKAVPELVTYYLRIDFESSCLSCHGTKASRPEFIVKKYPEDKAYDFSPKDLRGVYQVVQTLKANAKEQRKEEKSW